MRGAVRIADCGLLLVAESAAADAGASGRRRCWWRPTVSVRRRRLRAGWRGRWRARRRCGWRGLWQGRVALADEFDVEDELGLGGNGGRVAVGP